jgi:putative sterol carrier protein
LCTITHDKIVWRNRMPEPTLDEMTVEIRRRVGSDSGFGHTVLFDFGDAGCIYVDAKNVPHTVDNEPRAADTTVGVKYADFCKIADGAKDPTSAFMAGRLKVTGNVAAAWKLGSIMSPP